MPSFILPLILGVFAFSLYAASIDQPHSFDSKNPSRTTIQTEANLEGWHIRALNYERTNTDSFEPQLKNLKLALLRNGPVETKGFSLAIFVEDNGRRYVVVDAMGRVMVIPSPSSGIKNLPRSSSDIKGLLDLGLKVLKCPRADEWRNTWRIKSSVTSQLVDRFFYVSGQEMRQISVSGYSRTETELAWPVAGFHRLPDDLHKLFGLVLEARKGYKPDRHGGNAEQKVISKVQAELGDLYSYNS